MNKKLRLFASLVLCANIAFANINTQDNKVLAKVDKYEITKYQVKALVTSKLQKTFFHQNLSEEKKKELDNKALEELIQRELLFRFAKEKKILVETKLIEDKKDEIIKKFPSKKAFEKTLKQNNLSIEDLKRDIEAEETMKLLYSQEIEYKPSIEDLENYYKKNAYKFKKPESKSYQLILINIDPIKEDGIKEAKETITKLKQRIIEGEKFEDIALKHSHDMSRINGGNIGFVHKGTFKYLKEEDLDLQKGELSKIIQTDIGFYLIKLLEVKEETQLSFDEVKFNLKKDLKTSEERKRLNKIIEDQKLKLKVVFLNK